MTTVHVTARSWSGGWELWLDDDNLTSVRLLRDATRQVRDYLDTVEPETSHDDIDVEVEIVGAPGEI